MDKPKNKLGQFYIITALMLIIPTYALIISQNNNVKERTTNFDILYENYINEAEITINNALYNQENVYSEMEDFTTDFIDYSKTKNIDLKLVYMIKKEDEIKVANYLKTEVKINNLTLKNKETMIINSTNEITLNYEETEYDYIFSNKSIEFKALLVR